MTDNTLEMVIRARDEATAVIQKVAKSVSGMGTDLSSGASKIMTSFDSASKASTSFAKSLVSLPSLIIGVGTSFGALAALNTAGELETMQMGFKTLLGSAEAAGRTMERIKKEAAATPFELTGLTSATQALALITKDGDQAIDVLLNVGKALSAAGKGQAELDRIISNLQQIALTGKITEMDIRQFGMNGVNILEMLAEYYGTTTAEAVEMVKNSKNAFGDLSAAFAMAGSEGGKFANAYKDQAGTFNQLVSNMKDNLKIFLSEFAKQSGLFDTAKKALQRFNDAMPEIIKGMEKFFKLLKENQWVIYSIAGAIIGALIPALLAALPAIALFVAGLAAGAVALLPWVLGGALIGGIVAGIVWLIQNWEIVSAKATEIWNSITSYLTGKWNEMTMACQGAWNSIKDFTISIWQGISDFFTSLWEGIKNVALFSLGFMTGSIIMIFESFGIDITAIIESLKILIPMAWQWISDKSMEMWNGMREFFMKMGETIKGIWTIVMNWLKNFFASSWDLIRNSIMEKINLVVDIFKLISPTITDIWSKMWNGMRDIVIGIWDKIVEVVKTSINFIIDGINTLIRALNSVAQRGSKMGLSVPTIPEIPRLAQGGIVSKPTIAMVGEAGPEAIVPLKKGGQTSFGSGDINVYVSNNNFYGDDREFSRKIAQDLADELRLAIRI